MFVSSSQITHCQIENNGRCKKWLQIIEPYSPKFLFFNCGLVTYLISNYSWYKHVDIGYVKWLLVLNQMSMMLVTKDLINNKAVLIQIMAWHQQCNKILSKNNNELLLNPPLWTNLSEIWSKYNNFHLEFLLSSQLWCVIRTDTRLAPSQWDTALQCNPASHWLGGNLESALCFNTAYYDTVWQTKQQP